MSWFTPSNWSLEMLPTSATAASVNNGTTAIVDEIGGTAASLTVGMSVPGSTVQFVAGGFLTVTNAVTIGTGGTIEFSGGSLV